MGILNKLFGKGGAKERPTTSPTPPTPRPTDGLPEKITVKGLNDLAKIEFGEDDMPLPFQLWGHFDKALCHSWMNEIIITSDVTTPPSLSQIRALFDDLNAHFGPDGHGDGPFDHKDLAQWNQSGEVQRLFYFYGDNLSGVRYQRGQDFAPEDVLNKPSISVTIRRNINDPELDCTIELSHWDKLKARYLT